MTRPNILLIVFDTARADAFEPYGAAPGASPTVAQLASAGSASPATFATACWTVPSHISLFSGLLPRSAGFRPTGKVVGYRPQLRALERRLLPSVLARAGYRSVGFSTNGLVSPMTGFDTGFDEFVFVRGWRARKLAATSWRTRIAWYQEALRARLDDGAAELERRLEGWLSGHPPQPFFCFVNLVECHSPYLPPRPYDDLPARDRLRAALEARRHLTFSSIWKCATGGFDVPDEAIARMRHLYAASVRQLDAWLARVLDALSRHGLLDETQVVVTSDHGENLGDGRMLSHAFSLDDRLLRVPLVTAGPCDLPVEGPRSLQAVPRWLADVAGVEAHPFPVPGTVDGNVTVAQFDAPLEPEDRRVSEAIQAWGIDDRRAEEVARRLTTSFACATDGSIKLVRRLGREELFDLSVDPLEERPAVVGPEQERAYESRLGPLRAALDRARSDVVAPPGAAVDGQVPPAEMPEVPEEEVAQLEAQMRLLGYL